MSIRLINTQTLRLELFREGNIPDYAILSHTWVDGQEVSFQEMKQITEGSYFFTPSAAKKTGYAKTMQFCEVAKKDGFHFAWIDTCCIDKTSSAELSQQINSMYRWYSEAEKCYVYLSDLEPRRRKQSIHAKTKFTDCRWFQRGWCLQELIAPRSVSFYNKNWQCVGTKSDRKMEISKTTNINKSVLEDSAQIESFSVAQRMSWASGRVTTFVEDEAYCLLGIFGISMPLLYGEGRKAFMRLQEEIIKKSNDLSIFAFQADSLGSNLFASTSADFKYCGNIGIPENVFPGTEFRLTNNGLYFRCVQLQIDESEECYRMGLNCSSLQGQCFLRLQKFGPNTFLKLGSSDDNFSDSIVNPHQVENEVDESSSESSRSHENESSSGSRLADTDGNDDPDEISTSSSDESLGESGYLETNRPSVKYRPSKIFDYTDEASHSDIENIRDRRVEASEIYIATSTERLSRQIELSKSRPIQIVWDNSLGEVGDSLQQVTPSDLWDASRMQFLTMGRESFEAYMAVYPSQAEICSKTSQSASGDAHSDCFYLTCGVQDDQNDIKPWVRLYESSTWGRLVVSRGRLRGWKYIKELELLHDFSRDQVKLRTVTFSASISSDRKSGVLRLELKIDNTLERKKSDSKMRSVLHGHGKISKRHKMNFEERF